MVKVIRTVCTNGDEFFRCLLKTTDVLAQSQSKTAAQLAKKEEESEVQNVA